MLALLLLGGCVEITSVYIGGGEATLRFVSDDGDVSWQHTVAGASQEELDGGALPPSTVLAYGEGDQARELWWFAELGQDETAWTPCLAGLEQLHVVVDEDRLSYGGQVWLGDDLRSLDPGSGDVDLDPGEGMTSGRVTGEIQAALKLSLDCEDSDQDPRGLQGLLELTWQLDPDVRANRREAPCVGFCPELDSYDF